MASENGEQDTPPTQLGKKLDGHGARQLLEKSQGLNNE